MNSRLIASRVINEVTEGVSLSDCLPKALANIKDPRDKSFVQALCYGVCRQYTRLDVILSQLLKNPMKAKDSDVHALILVGLYQLIDMRVPEHAAVAETVNASEALKKPWARGFINAILRSYQREASEIAKLILQDEEAAYNHPDWWIRSLKKAWPTQWQSILEANNQHPPMSLRINQRHLSRQAYLDILKQHEINAVIIPETDNGIVLESALAVDALPGFEAGDLSVQDGAAQLAVSLLELAPGMRVLDACSAPGGKLAHMLETEPALSTCVAVENNPKRMMLINENLKRLGLKAECHEADAAKTNAWWDGKLFDRILIDAPCSASGVIRRHPDIKLLRFEKDIDALAKEQTRLLNALWPLLKPGGVLVYATCSVLPRENTGVLEPWLAAHPEAEEVPIQADWGMALNIGRQILPGMHGMDGFYYARLKKKSIDLTS